MMVDLYNLKTAIDIAQKDLHQKEAVQIEQATEAEEIKAKNVELDEEISQYESTALAELKQKLADKDDHVDNLYDNIREQEA